ncbi:MAG: hypothetical protein GY915_05840, partial [bacterium]|nr:hypothetical protein [bacterium]
MNKIIEARNSKINELIDQVAATQVKLRAAQGPKKDETDVLKELLEENENLVAINSSLKHNLDSITNSFSSKSFELEEAQAKIENLEKEIEAIQDQEDYWDEQEDETQKEYERLCNTQGPKLPFSQSEPSKPEHFNIGETHDSSAGGNSCNINYMSSSINPPTVPAYLGKQVDDKIDIKQWPSVPGFRAWKLNFKKAVAAAHRRAEGAFLWITEVEKATSIDDLADSGKFPDLDTKLSLALDSILSGEFKKTVGTKEIELSKEGKMIKGRQIAFMIYKNFKVSEIDGVMLEWESIIDVELRHDNLQQFLNDWEQTMLHIDTVPDERFLESLFRKQLEKSDQL